MDRVTNDYGERIGMALQAVRQLYEDSQRLLRECDSTIGKGKELATRSEQVTPGLSGSLNGKWYAGGAYRCYQVDPEKSPWLADAICLAFLGDDRATNYPPRLLVGRIQYSVQEGQDAREWCDGWDLWYMLEHAPDPIPYGEVVSKGQVQHGGKPWIEWFRLIAVPLYSVKSIDDVVALMDRVRAG
jgi:hypothetical protein